MTSPNPLEATEITLPPDIVNDVILTANTWIDALIIRAGRVLRKDIREKLFNAICTDLTDLVKKDATAKKSAKITYRNVCAAQEQGVTNLLLILPEILGEAQTESSSSQS